MWNQNYEKIIQFFYYREFYSGNGPQKNPSGNLMPKGLVFQSKSHQMTVPEGITAPFLITMIPSAL